MIKQITKMIGIVFVFLITQIICTLGVFIFKLFSDSQWYDNLIEAFMFIPDIAFDVIKHFDNIIPGVILIVVNALFIAKIISSYIIIADKNDVINIDNINENMDDK